MSLMLAGSLCLLPFLLPYHQQPIPSFFPEWLAAALGIAAALTLLVGRGVTAVSFVSSPHEQGQRRSEEHTSELQSQSNLVCRLMLENKKDQSNTSPRGYAGLTP